MNVKVRKVGNSYTVTIPSEIIQTLRLEDGQEMEVSAKGMGIEYRPVYVPVREIDWKRYEGTGDILDGMSPDAYVRKLRDDDR